MADVGKKELRNVALVGQSGAGKTSLGESMLYKAKVTTRKGDVAKGTSVLDHNPEEIERKISIYLSIAYMGWNGKLINLIDTPGYVDFWGETLSGIRATDNVIFVLDATTPIAYSTEEAWEVVQKYKLPSIIFVNKIATEHANFDQILEQAKELFGNKVAPIYYPDGVGKEFRGLKSALEEGSPYYEQLMESVAESTDELTEKYLTEGTLSHEDICKGLREGIKAGTIIPMLVGEAIQDVGTEELLNFIVEYLPAPDELHSDDGLYAFVFKSRYDPKFGMLRYVRVFSGTLEAGSEVFNLTQKQPEKINQIYLVQGKERKEVDQLTHGGIGALVKLKVTKTGDTLANDSSKEPLPAIEYPTPYAAIAIQPRTSQDEERISTGLGRLNEADPSFQTYYDIETRQRIIKGIGELHLNVILSELKRNFNVEVKTERPKIHYRETITKVVEVQGKYKKQTGGRGQYGDCWVRFEPLPRGQGFEFVDKIVGGRIPAKFIPAVEEGIKEQMQKGLLAGYPMTDIRAVLYDGSFHPVDSSDIAFKVAGGLALRNAKDKLGLVILEPILKVTVIVPEEYLGDVMGDINARRGKILGVEPAGKGKYQKINALVPEAEMYGFGSSLRAMTQGRASFTQEFAHYDVVPPQIQEKIVAEAQREHEEKGS